MLQATKTSHNPEGTLVCCTGRQAVKWLLHTAAVACDEAEAVAIGNALLHRGLLHHVVNSVARQLFDGMCVAAQPCVMPTALAGVSAQDLASQHLLMSRPSSIMQQYKHPFENRSHLYRFHGVGPERNESSDDDASAHGW